jgi:ribonucleoside-diphosphate reductase alpha chain
MTKLSENAQLVAEKRYFLEGEDWEGCCRRVGKAVASHETDRRKWEEVFSQEIYEMHFIPGGRTLRNAGTTKPQMQNCCVLSIGDSIEEIGDTIRKALIAWSYGLGIGINFSSLRDKGKLLKTKGGYSSGMMSFIKAIDDVAKTIETGGQRRSGLLALCRVDHPEIFDFIDAKQEDGDLSYTNLSVGVTDTFLKAVEDDLPFDLAFAGQTVRTVQARTLWDKIITMMIESGDPGLINLDNLAKNNSYYFAPVDCVNLCAELGLSSQAEETCCLGSLVLPNFISNKNTNWKKFEHSIELGVRFLDDVLDVNYYPLKNSEIAAKNGRRTGLGLMGLHDYLMLKGIRYGSDKAIQEIEKVMKFFRDSSYSASVKLAKEKGAFAKFNRRDYMSASFVKKLPAKIRMEIKKHGIRNVTVNSMPPTGTSSLLPEVSSGVEPWFSLAYKRQDRVSERIYLHPLLQSYSEIPDFAVDALSLTPEEHLETQVAIQTYTDSSVSKTLNCTKSITKDKLSDLLLEYVSDLKGLTIYVDGCKKGQVLNKLTKEEVAIALKKQNYETLESDITTCRSGSCEI